MTRLMLTAPRNRGGVEIKFEPRHLGCYAAFQFVVAAGSKGLAAPPYFSPVSKYCFSLQGRTQ